jgi:hypothetical protein
MERLVQTIFNELDKRNMPARSLAAAVDVDPGTISNLKNRPEIESKFQNMLAIIQYLFPDREEKLMEIYIRAINKPENLRLALEYASFNRNLPLLEYLINREINSDNRVNQEWAKVYQLMLQIQKYKHGEDFLIQLREARVTEYEMKILLRILECYYFYSNLDFQSFIALSRTIERDIVKITNKYISETFLVRISEILLNSHFRNGEIEQCRRYANLVINSNSNKFKKANAYLTLSYTYLFEDYGTTMKYLSKCRELLIEGGNVELAQVIENKSIAFAKCYWSMDLDTVQTNNEAEQAHLAIRKGNKDLAIDILSKIEEHTGFSKFYLGLATGNEQYYYESIAMFKQQGDLFFINLPLIELKRNGVNDYILEAII